MNAEKPSLPLISTGTTDQQVGEQFIPATERVVEQARKALRGAPNAAEVRQAPQQPLFSMPNKAQFHGLEHGTTVA